MGQHRGWYIHHLHHYTPWWVWHIMVGVTHHGWCGTPWWVWHTMVGVVYMWMCVLCVYIGKDFFLSSDELTVFIRRLRNTKQCMCFDFVYMTILGQNARFTITQGFGDYLRHPHVMIKALVAITHQMTNYIYLHLIPHICSLTSNT